jgi:hypothetical protein
LSGNIQLRRESGDAFTTDEGKYWSVGLNPSIEHFVSDGFYIGLKSSYSKSESNDGVNSILAIGPQLGGAFQEPDSDFITSFNLSYRFAGYKVNDDDRRGSVLGMELAVIFLAKEHLGIRMSGQYDWYSMELGEENTQGNLISIGIGVSGIFY